MYYAEYESTRPMYEDLVTKYMFSKPGDPIFSKTHYDRTYTEPAVIRLTHPVPDLDFAEQGWAVSRWKIFCQQYVDSGLMDWANNCLHLAKTAEYGYAFPVLAKHKNGNCIVYMSFKNNPIPTITLLSRSARLFPTSSLELSLINILVERFNQHFDQHVQLYWMIAQLQFSPMKAFTYLSRVWWPKFKDDPRVEEYQGQPSMNGWNRTFGRYEKYQTKEKIPAYIALLRDFQKHDKEQEPFTPHDIWIDGAWR